MSQNEFSKALEGRRKRNDPISDESILPSDIPTPQSTPTARKKRGRPATGKRSDDKWIGRTFYVESETDLDVEEELLKLKRQGFDLDKSELVSSLLGAWVKWRNGEDSEILMSEISPRRKSKNN